MEYIETELDINLLSQTIKQIKCEPPIDVVNYVPKTDITNDDTDGSDIGDVKEKPR